MKYCSVFLLVLCAPVYSMHKITSQSSYTPLNTLSVTTQADQKKKAEECVVLAPIAPSCPDAVLHQNQMLQYQDTAQTIIATTHMALDVVHLIMNYMPDLMTNWRVSHEFSGHTKPINSLLASNNGEFFSASADGSVRRWSLISREQTAANTRWADAKGLAQIPGSKLMVGDAMNGTLSLCQEQAITEDGKFKFYVSAMKVLASGRLLCAFHTAKSRKKNMLKVIQIEQAVQHTIDTIETEYHSIECVEQLPDGNIVVGCLKDWVEVFNSGESVCHNNVPTIAIIDFDEYDGKNPTTNELHLHEKPIYVLKILSDGRLASGSSDKAIVVWNMNIKWPIKILIGHTKSISAIEQLPCGDLLSSDYDGNIIIWDIESGARKHSLAHPGAVRALALGLYDSFISGGNDGIIRVWHQASCEQCSRAVVQPPAKVQQKPKSPKRGCCVLM